jgi:hypothetical protein
LATSAASDGTGISFEEVEDKGEISDREDILDVCKGYPDSVYPTPPVIDEVMPDDHVIQVNQEPPPEDEWYCKAFGSCPVNLFSGKKS